MLDDLTEDGLLDGRVRLCQPARGYRVAIDPVLLAAAVPVRAGERILDAGAGSGAASLCLAARVPDCRLVGLELERELARLASHNVALNGQERRIDMMAGDLGRPPPRLSGSSFDHVMTNPPFLAAGSGTPSPEPGRQRAHREGEVELAGWLAGCLRLLRPGGHLTLIQRAERLGEVLSALQGKAGDLVVFPLWPAAERRAAKRVLVQGRKGARGLLRLMRGLVLHEADGRFTPAAERILRHGAALPLADRPVADRPASDRPASDHHG